MKSPETLSDILSEGTRKYGLDIGIISKVYADTYKVVSCKDDNAGIKPGDEFELSHTYCFDVINENKTKYYRDVADITEMLKHPCYLTTQLRAYIGTPLIVNGEIWGTLNYSSLSPHKESYSKEETEFLESQARNVAAILEDQQI